MRIVISLILLLALASFGWSFVGHTTPVAQWSDIQYLIRDVSVSESTRSEIKRVVYQSRRDWLVVRCLSGGTAFLSLVGLFWPRKHDNAA